jgi:LPXTG-motif cell wall-anchored protein
MFGCTTTYVCSEPPPTSVPSSSNGSLVVMGLALLGAAIFLTARTRERD